jgi:predicted HTH domain antitoxin
MTAELKLYVDDSIFFSLKKGKEEFSKDILFYAAIVLLRKSKLSLGKAAELAGYTRLDFIDKMRFEKEPVFDYGEDYIMDTKVSVENFLNK